MHTITNTLEYDKQPNLRHLDLAVRQVQGGVGLARMPDSISLSWRGSGTHVIPNMLGCGK